MILSSRSITNRNVTPASTKERSSAWAVSKSPARSVTTAHNPSSDDSSANFPAAFDASNTFPGAPWRKAARAGSGTSGNFSRVAHCRSA
jgi:hypothetical protein